MTEQVDEDARHAAVSEALRGLDGVKLTAEQVLSHVIRPANVAQAVGDRGPGSAPRDRRRRPDTPAPRLSHGFDVGGFADALRQQIAPNVAGYAMRLQQDGGTIYTLEWNWAKEPQDGGEGWNPDVRMHVGSCSKLITAIAMTRQLAVSGISFDTAIAAYLPEYWTQGPNVAEITFGQLLTHTSGLHFGGDETGCDYAFMKAQIAAGTQNLGQYSYQNVNYSLCRVLLATIRGVVSTGFYVSFPFAGDSIIDSMWDVITTGAYTGYAGDYVFAPAGVADAGYTHETADALAYGFPVSGNGWNSGDLTTTAGAAGWHLTVDDLLKVMSAFRRAGTIVDDVQAQGMLDAGYGIDMTTDTQLGTLYAKNGGWTDGAGQTEQAAVFFLPLGMELAILANSPIGPQNSFLMGLVGDLYQEFITTGP